jgi:hypothetical protein
MLKAWYDYTRGITDSGIMAEKFIGLKKTSWLISGGFAIVAVLLGVGWFAVGRWLLQPPAPSLRNAPSTEPNQALPSETDGLSAAPVNQMPASPNLPAPTAQPQQRQLNPTKVAARQGILRISNPTDYPVRVALLGRKVSQGKANDRFKLPAHWDFAPQEGSSQGLVVSLPNQVVEVKPGDVLVAFSEDGSRRYWGPYILGETAFPTWSKQTGEWQLILQP